ncbi:MAG: glycoside hydrolase family 9 protein [Chitinophagaceae bacterium]|nr:glycoside hydrolase family 9 protein [Chitinophagaceae bacterium]
MKLSSLIFVVFLFQSGSLKCQTSESWIRINQLGYATNGSKVAILGSKALITINKFEIVDSSSNKVVFSGAAGRSFGEYGPFKDTYRLDFSAFKRPGKYILRVGETASPVFRIGKDVYDGAADFCLKYMRQQRSGFNPYLKDSCHTYDGYTLFAPVPDSTHIDVVGGWHDATDYLQYSTTSANATFHLLAAYRDFPKVFTDKKDASGLDGSNKIADVMDEARWGLNWLMKMHPKEGWIFNQLADDRDHSGMRLPKLDSAYGRGYERPVYFCNGKPQMRGKFMNNTTGAASTAGKFAAAFALGSEMFSKIDNNYAQALRNKSGTALQIGKDMPGVAQTASVKGPYIYAEDNWKDDMELGYAAVYRISKSKSDLDSSFIFASDEPVTPWLGADTAFHYQWYPFINVGHYELAKALTGERKNTVIGYYKEGIEKVWSKAKNNAFYRGVPFIWCSNNLTVSFAIQCYWYRKLTGDNSYVELERACFDWIFGCNPWGTSMVYGFPAWGDTPVDPHSSFTHVANYPIDGGLVDGPLYTATYRKQLGLQLAHEDEYAEFQSELAVYHDDVGDYSTNEPTMDGTASLIYLLAAMEAEAR